VEQKCLNAVSKYDLNLEYAKEINIDEELEYIWYEKKEITPDDFKKTYIQRYLFEHPEIAKLFPIFEGKSK
jgi:hypothetical protein